MTDEDKRTLHPATAAEIEETLSYALRYAGRKRVHTADDVMARVTAERLVQHLERSGYVYVTWNVPDIGQLEDSMLVVMSLQERWPIVAAMPPALAWLSMRADLGLAARTIDAYARGLSDYLRFCTGSAVDPMTAGTDHIARFVRYLTASTVEDTSLAPSSSALPQARLANATLHQRITVVRLFYDYLVEESLRTTNPVGRGRHGQRRGLLPCYQKLPWIPNEAEWVAILAVARQEPIRNRTMLALGYDAGLRREELCSLHTQDMDPSARTLRIRAETTKSRRERVVPYSAASGELLADYLAHRTTLSRARGPLFLSESRRNHAQPLTLWTWSKVIRRIALEAEVPGFSTHTLRHLCLTDLARAGVELHAIATFAGHRSPTTTLQYIHLSGRDLADKFAVLCSCCHRRNRPCTRQLMLS